MIRTTYATDGRCHNSNHDDGQNPAHECHKPAEWIGTTATGYSAGFCDQCRHSGREAKHIKLWRKLTNDNPRQDDEAKDETVKPQASLGLAWILHQLNHGGPS